MTVSEFLALFPEFGSSGATPADPTKIQSQLNFSAPHFDSSTWGDYLSEGQGSWVAHWLTIGTLSPVAGVGQSSSTTETVGRMTFMVSNSFSQAQAKDIYARTSYGLRYLSLVDVVGAGPVVP